MQLEDLCYDKSRETVSKPHDSNEDLKNFLSKINELSTETQGIPSTIQINSKDFDIPELREMQTTKGATISFLHINLISISYHIDALKDLISTTQLNWDVIGITETGIKKGQEPNTNISIPNYHDPISVPTETTKGGVILFISKRNNFKLRKDLHIYASTKIELQFLCTFYCM